MVGILTALSAVALVQYGKYKRNAGAEVASAQSQFESENCIGVPNRKQCLCEKGLGEVLGLDSEDCCPLGQEKDSNGNCVARVAQAPSTPTPAPATPPPPQTPQTCPAGQTRHTNGNCYPPCPSGQTRNSAGNCESCAPDFYPDGITPSKEMCALTCPSGKFPYQWGNRAPACLPDCAYHSDVRRGPEGYDYCRSACLYRTDPHTGSCI